MTDLIIWLIALITIIVLALHNYILHRRNELLTLANKILLDTNNEVMRNMIKFNEEIRLIKIEFDNACRKVR